ncbi:fibronectin type III domain-containing protein [Brevibacillus agri]|uniref:fibronectin type III domain-containing protein n=1 Tax=Brevibacillus TaxID=55080 RepID=UPI001EE5BC98|nr:fibronectin type III domain-containing protein [Brevibacillus agri]MCG5254147.1 fibronectin type III domain-containing protein [Brevibacillus agri]
MQQSWKTVGLALVILTGQPVQVMVAANPSAVSEHEEWTLATVPTLSVTGVSGNTHTVQIETNNPLGTEMKIEKSGDPDFSVFDVVQDWTPHNDRDTFTLDLQDAETVYVRIKARNGKGIETLYSETLTLIQAPAMPTLASQESTDRKVTLIVNPVQGAHVYKVKRSDWDEPKVFTDLTFTDDTVLPGRPYTYEFWAENSVMSNKNTITIWTKPAPPILKVQNVTATSITLKVNLNRNPDDVLIEAKREGGNPVVNGTLIEETGLKENTEYTYEVRVESSNHEYSEWVSKTFRTGTMPVTSDPDQEFDKAAEDIFSEVVYQVDADDKGAWVDVSVTNTRGMDVRGTINGVTQLLSATPVRYGDLEWNKEYLLTVVVSDGTRMREKQYPIKTPEKGTTEEEAFRKEAAQFIQSINLVADGQLNSGKAWIDVEVPQTNFAVTATIEGFSQEITKKARFENLDDNTVYVVSFEVRNGKYSYRAQREITTPNRTAPEVVNISKSGNHLQIEVLTHSELKN